MNKKYEKWNHLGNVLEVITDRKLPTELGTTGTVDYFTADVIAYTDYYPYGMVMPERNGGEDFRYGFDGMEMDDEVKSVKGSSYDFGARMYDPRVGRWLSIDPQQEKYPCQSPYHFAGNSPLQYKDPNGEEVIITIEKTPGGNYVITMSAKIYLTGTGVTDDYVQGVQNEMNNMFTNFTSANANGPNLAFVWDVQVIDASKASRGNTQGLPAAIIQQNSLSDDEYFEQTNRGGGTNMPEKRGGMDKTGGNMVRVFDDEIGKSSSSTSQNYAYVFDGLPGMAEAYSKEQKIMATIHEIGHLLGLIDRYISLPNGGSVPLPGWTTDFMGNAMTPNPTSNAQRMTDMANFWTTIITIYENQGKLDDGEETIVKENESY